MKVLTIKQPFASLIVNKYKKYEFRTWKTNYRGKILIHAGLSKDKRINDFSCYNLNYVFGSIIGEAEIYDCKLIDEKFKEELLKENSLVYKDVKIGEYAFCLKNIKKYENTITIKGKLGLWNYK